jgi:hypothetical protein
MRNFGIDAPPTVGTVSSNFAAAGTLPGSGGPSGSFTSRAGRFVPTKGGRVLRFEAIAHNTAEVRCGLMIEKFPRS